MENPENDKLVIEVLNDLKMKANFEYACKIGDMKTIKDFFDNETYSTAQHEYVRNTILNMRKIKITKDNYLIIKRVLDVVISKYLLKKYSKNF